MKDKKPKGKWGGSKPGERRSGGRPKGARNKTTLEREQQERLDLERIEEIERLQATGAKEVVAAAQTAGIKLMKDIAFDFARKFAGLAAFYQPWPDWRQGPDGKPVNANPNFHEGKFKEYAVLARDTALGAAQFQSPKFSAVMVGATVTNQVEVLGGLPDEQDGGLVGTEPPTIEAKANEEPALPLPKAVND